MAIQEFEKLIEILSEISVLSSKQCKTLAHFLVNNAAKIKEPLKELTFLLEKIQCCSICKTFTIDPTC